MPDEFFRLISQATVFRLTARYFAAEIIPAVNGVTIDRVRFGGRWMLAQTQAREADIIWTDREGRPLLPLANRGA